MVIGCPIKPWDSLQMPHTKHLHARFISWTSLPVPNTWLTWSSLHNQQPHYIIFLSLTSKYRRKRWYNRLGYVTKYKYKRKVSKYNLQESYVNYNMKLHFAHIERSNLRSHFIGIKTNYFIILYQLVQIEVLSLLACNLCHGQHNVKIHKTKMK